MERRRESLGIMHSEEEDEDHMQRISMCFSIDISERLKKQNRIHNLNQITATERGLRNPGGGLFGNVEDRHPHRSYMSFTVPNRFFADSREVCQAYDSYQRKRPKETHRRSLVPYQKESWPTNCYNTPSRHSGIECYNYPRPQKSRHSPIDPYDYHPRRQKSRHSPIECYDYPRPLKSHRTPRNYNSSRYEERPRREHYPQRDYYNPDLFREPVPELVYKKKHRKPAQVSEESCNIYSSEYPRKSTQNAHRKKSGWDYQQYYETRPENCYYNNQQYNSDYYDDSKIYRTTPQRKKSVEFLTNDCEIPYNILKRARHKNEPYKYAENKASLALSTVDIPYRKKRRRRYSYEPEPELEPQAPKRTESGSSTCRPRKKCIDEKFLRSHKKTSRAFNPFTRSSQRLLQERELCCKKSRKSLKEKISGFFKKCKRKSRKSSKSKMCLSNFKSVSSISCIVAKSEVPVAKSLKPCGCPIVKKTKCIAYPTVYREKCPTCTPTDENAAELSQFSANRSKVNCCQFATTKCAKLSVIAPSYSSFRTEEPSTNGCDSFAKKTYYNLPENSAENDCSSSEAEEDSRKNCSCCACESSRIATNKQCSQSSLSDEQLTGSYSYSERPVDCLKKPCKSEHPSRNCGKESCSSKQKHSALLEHSPCRCSSTDCSRKQCKSEHPSRTARKECCGYKNKTCSIEDNVNSTTIPCYSSVTNLQTDHLGEECSSYPSRTCKKNTCSSKKKTCSNEDTFNSTSNPFCGSSFDLKKQCSAAEQEHPSRTARKECCGKKKTHSCNEDQFTSSNLPFSCSSTKFPTQPGSSSSCDTQQDSENKNCKTTAHKMCCCASCVNELLLNQIKHSTINVCLKICTPDGKLLEPSKITATLEQEELATKAAKTCSSNILTSPAPSVSFKNQPSNSSETSTNSKCNCVEMASVICMKKNPDACNLNKSQVNLNISPNASETSTICTENNYITVRADQSISRPGSNTSCPDEAKLPKSILSTSKKCSCSSYNRRSEESMDWKQQTEREESLPDSFGQQSCSCSRKNSNRKVCCVPENDCAENYAAGTDCCIKESCLVKKKKSNPRVEFACENPMECPKKCEKQTSIVEELKKELLNNLKSEQKLKIQKPIICPCALNCQPCWKTI